MNRVNSLPRRASAQRNLALSIAVAAALTLPAAAGAFEFDTGNEDLSIRFDNTVRANVSVRAESQDDAILANPNFDDGDRNFDSGSVFTRLDLLSEFDVVWKRSLGFRVSATGWWDPGYGSLDNKSLATSNNLNMSTGLPVLGLDPHTQRYAEGPSGEFLDVFAFAKFDVGDAPVNVKLGQTTVYWGEGLLLGGALHGVSYSQNPIDVWKGYATPGSEAKELFRPRVGFNVQSQVTDTVSRRRAVFLQLAEVREPGLSISRGRLLPQRRRSPVCGPASRSSSAGTRSRPRYRVPRPTCARGAARTSNPTRTPATTALRCAGSPEWADATLGAYYRRTYDMQPQLMLTPGFANGAEPGSLHGHRRPAPRSHLPHTLHHQPAGDEPELTCAPGGRVGTYNVAFGRTSTSSASACRRTSAASASAPS